MTQEPTDVPAIPDYQRLLDGKVAVVTGGGDGIGGAISRLFAEHGALVEIAEIDPERAAAKQAEIEARATPRAPTSSTCATTTGGHVRRRGPTRTTGASTCS